MNVRRALRQDGVEDYIINSNARASQGVIWVKDSGIFRRLSLVLFSLLVTFFIIIIIIFEWFLLYFYYYYFLMVSLIFLFSFVFLLRCYLF